MPETLVLLRRDPDFSDEEWWHQLDSLKVAVYELFDSDLSPSQQAELPMNQRTFQVHYYEVLLACAYYTFSQVCATRALEKSSSQSEILRQRIRAEHAQELGSIAKTVESNRVITDKLTKRYKSLGRSQSRKVIVSSDAPLSSFPSQKNVIKGDQHQLKTRIGLTFQEVVKKKSKLRKALPKLQLHRRFIQKSRVHGITELSLSQALLHMREFRENAAEKMQEFPAMASNVGVVDKDDEPPATEMEMVSSEAGAPSNTSNEVAGAPVITTPNADANATPSSSP